MVVGERPVDDEPQPGEGGDDSQVSGARSRRPWTRATPAEHEQGRAQRPRGRRPQQDLEEREAEGERHGQEARGRLSRSAPGSVRRCSASTRRRGSSVTGANSVRHTWTRTDDTGRPCRRSRSARRRARATRHRSVGNASQAAAASASEGGTSSSCERWGPVRAPASAGSTRRRCGEHAEAATLPRRQGSESGPGRSARRPRPPGAPAEWPRAHAFAWRRRGSSVQDDDLVPGGDPLVVDRPALLVRDAAHVRDRAAARAAW